jgi:L-asparaginase
LSKRVLILHTGGTLGMAPRHPDRALAPSQFGSTLLRHVPQLRQLAAIRTRVLYNLDSSDMSPRHWKRIAVVVARALEDHDGVVVTHGTDTMAYTASALSYLLRNLPRPVVLTGAQRTLAEPHSDARGNLVGAVDLAMRDIPEVSIYFHGVLLRGNRSTKTSSFAYGAFSSPNFSPLAEVGTDVRLVARPLRPARRLRLVGDFDGRVAVVRLVPGRVAPALDALADTEIRAVLLEAFGVGNIPVEDGAVARALHRLTKAGKIVAVGSQAAHGGVDLMRYAGGRLARECGAIGTGDMTLEAAAVKLMYLLGTVEDPREIKRRLMVPIAGELTVRKDGG